MSQVTGPMPTLKHTCAEGRKTKGGISQDERKREQGGGFTRLLLSRGGGGFVTM
jgi:hypothetical protein